MKDTVDIKAAIEELIVDHASRIGQMVAERNKHIAELEAENSALKNGAHAWVNPVAHSDAIGRRDNRISILEREAEQYRVNFREMDASRASTIFARDDLIHKNEELQVRVDEQVSTIVVMREHVAISTKRAQRITELEAVLCKRNDSIRMLEQANQKLEADRNALQAQISMMESVVHPALADMKARIESLEDTQPELRDRP